MMMMISCPAHMFPPLLYRLDQYWNSWETTGNPSHLSPWTLIQGNTGGLLLRGKQLRHRNWLLWAIQTPYYSHPSMAGCPLNAASLATSGHLPYTSKIPKKENLCGSYCWTWMKQNSLNCIVTPGRNNERNKKWNPHISVTWLILINGSIITENSVTH